MRTFIKTAAIMTACIAIYFVLVEFRPVVAVVLIVSAIFMVGVS